MLLGNDQWQTEINDKSSKYITSQTKENLVSWGVAWSYQEKFKKVYSSCYKTIVIKAGPTQTKKVLYKMRKRIFPEAAGK